MTDVNQTGTDQTAPAAKDQKFREATKLREEINDQFLHHLVIGREEFKDNPHYQIGIIAASLPQND